MRILLLLTLFTACSGYKFRKKENPFMQYGINSLSVPVFYNHSNLPNASMLFTKKIFNTMTDYKDLVLKSGKHATDAVLIGVIESSDKRRDTITSDGFRKVENAFDETNLNPSRDDFFVPTSNLVQMRLRIIVIKHPTKEEIEFLKSSYGSQAISSKIIFNETIRLSEQYNLREIDGELSPVLGTQNRGVMQSALNSMSDKAAANFKDMILYAF